MRVDGRNNDELRPVTMEPGFLKHPHGSVLISCGNTRLICSAFAADELPPWMRYQKISGGWVTGEYDMLPGSTSDRNRRSRGGGVNGRSQEIQRLIGRSLRGAVDLEALGARTIYLDCDVIDADGGTRCAAITGAMVALEMAIARLLADGLLKESPILRRIAAVSVGFIDGEAMLDLCYEEDVRADVDMNVVMTDDGRFVEVQATAEGEPYSGQQLQTMLQLADRGIRSLVEIQQQVGG